MTETFQASLPSAPLAPSYSNHWLAVDGVQPEIAQNPPKRKLSKLSTSSSSSSTMEKGESEVSMVSHILSHEMQLLFGKVSIYIVIFVRFLLLPMFFFKNLFLPIYISFVSLL